MAKKTKAQKLSKRQENPEKWKKKQIFIIAYTALMVFYGFYTMFLSVTAYAQFSGTVKSFDNMITNLELEPITEIKLSTGGAFCESGWEPLFGYNWSGTVNGCNCATATKGTDKDLHRNTCSTNQTSAGCTKVGAVSGQTFEQWNINSNKVNICVKRLAGSKYFESLPSKLECGSGYKACGNSQDEKSLFCVKTAEKCPIYKLQLDEYQKTSLLNDDYEELELPNTGLPSGSTRYSLFYKRSSQDHQPIAELRVGEGKGICMDNTDKNIQSGHSDYTLMSDRRSQCSETDPRFIQLTTGDTKLGEKNYYNAQGVLTKLEALPKFTSTNDHTYSQYNRNFITWKLDKREDLKDIVGRKDSINSMSNSQLFIMVINILVCIVVSIILTMSQVYNLMGKDVPCIDGDGEEEQTRIKNIKKGLQYGAKLIQTPFCLWAFSVAQSHKGFVRPLADSNPSDDLTNKDLTELASLIENDVYGKDLQMLITLVIVILVDVALYVRKRMKKNKKKQAINPEEEKPIRQNEEKETPIEVQDLESNEPVTGGYVQQPQQQQGFVQQPPQAPQTVQQPPSAPQTIQQPPPGPQTVQQPPPGPQFVEQPPE